MQSTQWGARFNNSAVYKEVHYSMNGWNRVRINSRCLFPVAVPAVFPVVFPVAQFVTQ